MAKINWTRRGRYDIEKIYKVELNRYIIPPEDKVMERRRS
jgi:hypothetical protein